MWSSATPHAKVKGFHVEGDECVQLKKRVLFRCASLECVPDDCFRNWSMRFWVAVAGFDTDNIIQCIVFHRQPYCEATSSSARDC